MGGGLLVSPSGRGFLGDGLSRRGGGGFWGGGGGGGGGGVFLGDGLVRNG